jgi:hypothetical protein
VKNKTKYLIWLEIKWNIHTRDGHMKTNLMYILTYVLTKYDRETLDNINFENLALKQQHYIINQ